MAMRGPRLHSWILFLISELFAFLIVFYLKQLAIYTYWKDDDQPRKYAWQVHSVYISSALILLNGHGMVIFRLLPGLTTKPVKYMHTLTYVIVLLGSVYKVMHDDIITLQPLYSYRDEQEYHFHTYLAYFAMILLVFEFVSGIYIYWLSYWGQRLRREFTSLHNYIALVFFWISIIASCEHLEYMYYNMRNYFLIPDTYKMATYYIIIYGLTINSIVLNPSLEWRLVSLL